MLGFVLRCLASLSCLNLCRPYIRRSGCLSMFLRTSRKKSIGALPVSGCQLPYVAAMHPSPSGKGLVRAKGNNYHARNEMERQKAVGQHKTYSEPNAKVCRCAANWAPHRYLLHNRPKIAASPHTRNAARFRPDRPRVERKNNQKIGILKGETLARAFGYFSHEGKVPQGW